MAANQTEHYKLNQWELTDSVVMADFNEDNQKIEQALLDAKTKFQVGTYIGTGTYGAENPNSLTFKFQPQLVIIVPEPVSAEDHQMLSSAESASPLVVIQGAKTAPMSYDSGPYNSADYASALINLSWDSSTLRWYGNESSAHLQYNAENMTYRYLAIG